MKMPTWALHVAGRQSAAPLPPCGSLKSMCLIWTPVELETTGHARIVGNKWWWWFHRSPCGPNKIFIYPHIKKREPSSRYKKTLRYPKEKILKDLVEKIKSITQIYHHFVDLNNSFTRKRNENEKNWMTITQQQTFQNPFNRTSMNFNKANMYSNRTPV